MISKMKGKIDGCLDCPKKGSGAPKGRLWEACGAKEEVEGGVVLKIPQNYHRDGGVPLVV